MSTIYNRFSFRSSFKILPNAWDFVALIMVLGMLAAFVWAGKQITSPYHVGQPFALTLDPLQLPKYALFTVLRLFTAMAFSLLFTFTVGTLAAKNKRAARIIIPCIDILQSVPVIGLLSITIVGFITLFQGSRLGPEAAAIFAVFTAQVWNITLSFYQSLRSVPTELKEAADIFHLSSWQRFWRLDVPFSMPGLLWNIMMSMSASWIFLIASESISVNNQTIILPGIGSYLGLAINRASISGVIYTILTMFVVILLYDQLLFRPLLNWSKKFTFEQVSQEYVSRSWLTSLLQQTYILKYLGRFFGKLGDTIVNISFFKTKKEVSAKKSGSNKFIDFIWYSMTFVFVSLSLWLLLQFILKNLSLHELIHVFFLGCITALRIISIILIASIIWIPIGVFIGLNRRIAEWIQPIAQFFAAFPANVLFPIVVILILKYHLNFEIWSTPLLLLGTQWYILFNVIAGTAALPEDLKEVSSNFGVKGWQWWRRLILPGIFPHWITGTITAIGGGWNLTILTEIINWGSITLVSTGLGAYIAKSADAGDFPRIALGMAMMSLFVLVMNHLVWRPLYNLSQSRYRLD
ncbi:ABC transporter permease [Rickettsiella grylli]|uniref:ABC transporter, permease protein n=2 Tax=Rickettsiella grylli TaxID=59196 RepID=A8PPZ9_9COXI|nr:ABC transporter, permease protein [Rickettsiella grylli]